ncbi:HNH endonuclease signature motif containing protein [Kribbella sp. CA-293567]|uniref:HNH endonuclease signature motif containing protein n=1 Tax=Kribbella sp. CA-293567 TaxID=3002436 RepID=UPI0022DD304C|nr:DUF222 domain-containing protein [Kribbella sp. CA-293567]WBQ08025.1 DUF222 domain-containing protein [Kribbella sp. CA-293567]
MDISQLPAPCHLSDSDLLTTLDTANAALSTLLTWYWRAGAEIESRGLAKDLGAKDTTELLSLRHRHDPGPLRRNLKLAAKLPRYEAVTAALTAPASPDTDDAAGSSAVLSAAHAQTIITTLEKAPPTVPADLLRVAEEQLINAAHHLTPIELRDFGHQVLARLDTDGPEPTNDPYREESLNLRPVDGGIKFNGYLAAENAELLKTQIHRLAKPHKTIDGERDPRSRDKRQADALTTILEIAAGATATPGIPGVPHLTVTIDFADLQNAAAGAPRATGATGELVFGHNLSASAVRRLACEAAVLPIVLGSKSQPLDVGTEQRFVTGAIRRALNKRDKGCVICHAPPSNCHAHHLIHWANGGSTSITNLVLVCGAHHTAVHDGHWTITITDDVVHVTRPSWTDPGPTTPLTWNNSTAGTPPTCTDSSPDNPLTCTGSARDCAPTCAGSAPDRAPTRPGSASGSAPTCAASAPDGAPTCTGSTPCSEPTCAGSTSNSASTSTGFTADTPPTCTDSTPDNPLACTCSAADCAPTSTGSTPDSAPTRPGSAPGSAPTCAGSAPDDAPTGTGTGPAPDGIPTCTGSTPRSAPTCTGSTPRSAPTCAGSIPDGAPTGTGSTPDTPMTSPACTPATGPAASTPLTPPAVAPAVTAPLTASPAAGLSWLTPEAVARLNPWGESGTPSTGP